MRPASPSRPRLRDRLGLDGRRAAGAVLLMLGLPLAGLAGGYYLKEAGQLPRLRAGRPPPPKPGGIGLPVNNRLDPRYADADGDLVADPPTDPAQRLDPEALVLVPGPEGGGDSGGGGGAAESVWQPLADHLARATGKPVRVAAPAVGVAAAEQLRAVRDGAAHVAVLGAGLVPTAVNACGFVPVARLPGRDGAGWTRMAVVVPAGSPHRSPADLRGAQLTFVEPASNVGFKAAVIALRSDFGLLPGRDFTWVFSGGSEESVRAVRDGRAAAAAVDAAVLARLAAAGEVAPDAVRVIYESEPFPTAAVGHAHHLAPDLARRVREAILSFDARGTGLEPWLGGGGGGGGTRLVPADYRASWSAVRRNDDATGTRHVVN